MAGSSAGRDLRFLVEAVTAALGGLLGVITLAWHDWLESFGWEPDGGSGTAESFLVAALLVIALVSGVAARLRLRRISAQQG